MCNNKAAQERWNGMLAEHSVVSAMAMPVTWYLLELLAETLFQFMGIEYQWGFMFWCKSGSAQLKSNKSQSSRKV